MNDSGNFDVIRRNVNIYTRRCVGEGVYVVCLKGRKEGRNEESGKMRIKSRKKYKAEKARARSIDIWSSSTPVREYGSLEILLRRTRRNLPWPQSLHGMS